MSGCMVGAGSASACDAAPASALSDKGSKTSPLRQARTRKRSFYKGRGRGEVKKCSPSGLRGPQPRRAEARSCSRMLTHCALRRLLPVRLAELYCHDVLCCSPTAADVHEPAASCSPPQWGGGELRGSEEPQYSHASASPAAEAISDKGRPRRRSVKNRRLFDPQKCEASDSAQALRPAPKSFHRGGFWRHLLTSKGGIIG